MIEIKTKNKRFYSILIFCTVLLFNPNISVVDVLPDFVAWFALAKIFERAADSAPYFEEARVSFTRLGWLTLAKVAAIPMISIARSGNTLDNDIFALTSFSFAVFEAILAINAVRQIFTAVNYLGERSRSDVLLLPFSAPIAKIKLITVDSLKEFTYFFFICKCVLYTLPDMFLLTRVSDSGHIISISRAYPYVLILSQLIGFTVGIIWLLRMRKYIDTVRSDENIDESLSSFGGFSPALYEKKKNLRKTNRSMTAIVISAFLSFELIFDNFNNINILPHFIYAASLIIAAHLISRRTSKKTVAPYVIGGVHFSLSLVSYIFSVIFHAKFEYLDLMDSVEARRIYRIVQIFGVLEFLALVIFIIFIAKILKSFIFENTGIPPTSERYSVTELNYHKNLTKKVYSLAIIAVATGLAKFVNIFLNANVQLIFTNINDVTEPTIAASPVPWFNLIVTVMSIVYIGYSMHFASEMKEEVQLSANEAL